MAFEKITKGEWSLPHFITKEDEHDCACGFILAHECEESVANIYYKRDDSTEQSEYPNLETAKANAELICFCGNLQQRLDISRYEEVVKALEETMNALAISGIARDSFEKADKILTKSKRQ